MKYLILLLLLSNAHASLTLQVESGLVWQQRNDAKIPPKTGNQLEFDQFDSGPFTQKRLELHYQGPQKHGIRIIYAPFSIEVSGKSKKDIVFDGSTFLKNEDIDITYQFNSYRIGYVYSLSTNLKIGLTLKQRDALIRFEQGSLKEEYDNIGLVPLFYFSYETNLSDGWQFYTDADFAAASQGRAIDLTLKFRKSLTKNTKASIGSRSLDGGADNEKVYTYSQFHYLVVDLQLTY